jgi:hypothetical protein
VKTTQCPSAAAAAVDRLLADPGLNDAERGLLTLLKSPHPRLIREVWPRLEQIAPGCEPSFIEVVLGAYREAHSFSKPMPNRRNATERTRRAEESVTSGISSPLEVGVMAQALAQFLTRAGPELRSAYNTRRSKGQPDYDAMIASLQQVDETFERVSADWNEQRQRRCQEGMPRPSFPRKLGAENANEVHFSRILSYGLSLAFERPCDAIVSAMTAFVFGKGHGLEPSARSRRRVAHSAQKSR